MIYLSIIIKVRDLPKQIMSEEKKQVRTFGKKKNATAVALV